MCSDLGGTQSQRPPACARARWGVRARRGRPAAVPPGASAECRGRGGRAGGDCAAGASAVRAGGTGDEDGAESCADAEPGLAGLAAASVQGVLALGSVAGRRPLRLGHGEGRMLEGALPAPRPDTPHARWESFDLHAGVVVPGHRERQERLCRYVLRPPVTGDRLAVATDGRVVLRLRHPWADGTTHVAFEPTAFLERLAVLVPRPRINLLLYHGVLAAHAAWRADVVARAPAGGAAPAGAESDNAAATSPGPAGRGWADLMRRAFEVDVLACTRCGGRLRLVNRRHPPAGPRPLRRSRSCRAGARPTRAACRLAIGDGRARGAR